jgi:hypothetical protein
VVAIVIAAATSCQSRCEGHRAESRSDVAQSA